ncbi:alkaline phosphatase D family protein [Flavobacterium sp. LB2R40]|uniref:alkaline phosphatase D family protein n=1 Tax=unclassified Flavobacterium TaxID=196869 RepID=UPI003AAA911B
MKKTFQLFCILFISYSFAQNGILQSGPMVGYCEMTEAVIWLQTNKKASVKIAYFTIDNPSKIFYSDVYSSSKEAGFTHHIILDQLSPGKKYKYTVFINDKEIILPYETSFSSKKLWEWREDAPDFTVAIGSCSYFNETPLDRPGKAYGSEYGIFESIAKKNPEIMIWSGDNIYLREADWDSKTGVYHRYTHSRSIKEIQPLLAKTQNFAIWDDHDFGPDDSDGSFYNKFLTQKAFKDFWANKSYGMNPEQNEGIYSTFSWGDAQFFLLDDRFFKTPNNRITGERTVLGNTQLEWLINALSFSKASFKIIVIGGQVLNSVAEKENYSNYPKEKERLLKEILDNKIKGVLFISGDRHFTEFSEVPRDNTYPLYDWTVSPLTSGVASENILQENNIYRTKGSLIAQHNFGTLSFLGSKENRQMKLTIYDTKGTPLWNKTILKKELQ